jgi:hypothetical protein
MVATALAGVVSLANRVSLQPARQRLRQAASRGVLPAPAEPGSTDRALPPNPQVTPVSDRQPSAEFVAVQRDGMASPIGHG